MNILVISKDTLHMDAIVGYLRQNEKVRLIQTSECPLEVERMCWRNRFEIIIFDLSTYPFGHSNYMDKLCKLPMMETASYIALVSDIQPFELARIMAIDIKAILHINEVAAYFQKCIFEGSIFKTYLSPKIQLEVGAIPPEDHVLNSLSRMELQIAILLTQGFSNKQIADKIFRSALTVENHPKSVKEKLWITGGKNALLAYLIPYTLWLRSKLNK